VIYLAVPKNTEEFDGAEFGDKRLGARLKLLASRLGEVPGKSLPEAARDGAELEATYRFLGNSRVTAERILAPHFRCTIARAVAAKVVFIAHDTSEIRYSGARHDLGFVMHEGHGFFAHVGLLVASDGSRDALGVLNLRTHARSGPAPKRKLDQRPPEELESWRWWEGVRDVGQLLEGKAEAIHLMDREADSYRLLARMLADGHRFVVRSKHDRRLDVAWPDTSHLRARLELAEQMIEREVPVSKRKTLSGQARAAHPPRLKRIAKLAISAARVSIAGAEHAGGRHHKALPSLPINVVRVFEVGAPEGETPIEWLLLTSEPIATIEQMTFVVDAYRARWVVEEFFKSLKSGCSIEKRQLETKHGLVNILAVSVPVAWRLLRLRDCGRSDVESPATAVISRLELRLLQAHRKVRMPSITTALDAMTAVAMLGGHLKRNGLPGWQVLGRGFERLLYLVEGANLDVESCDQ
jgi:hypothetical protein